MAALGRRDEAIPWLTDSLAVYASTGNRRAAAQAALDLGTLESVKAPDRLDRAIGLAGDTGMDGVLAQAHLRHAQVAAPADKAMHLAAAEAAAAPLGWVALSAKVADAKQNQSAV